jgi:RHS repeat-associated protein
MTRSIGIHTPRTPIAPPVAALRYTRAVQRLVLLLIGLGLALVSPAQAQTVEYNHLDALGSVRAVTDASGAVLRRHDYKPFGEEVPISSQVALGDKKLFTGHEHDNETALDYFGARYYRADVGRFTTVDPAMTIKDNLVDPQRWNRYAYVTNNPLKYTDPDGRWPVSIDHWIRTYGSIDAKIRAWISDKSAAVPVVGDTLATNLDSALSMYLPVSADEFVVSAQASVFALAIPIELPATAQAKVGVAGGPGAGKTFSLSVKNAARSESSQCVFCGAETTREAGPLQSNVDHAVARSRGGTNTLENAQNTCRTCNLKKGTKSTGEFLRWLFGLPPQ